MTKDQAQSLLESGRSAIAGLPKNVESLAGSSGKVISDVLGVGAGAAATAARGGSDAIQAFQSGLRGFDASTAARYSSAQGIVSELARADDKIRVLRERRRNTGFFSGADRKDIDRQMKALMKERNKRLKEIAGNTDLPESFRDRVSLAFGSRVTSSSDEAQDLIRYMNTDDSVREFGGNPVDPATTDMIGSIVRRMFGGDSSRQATEAASGLGKALSDIPPAYLAAAAGAGGVAGGMMLGSGPS